MTLHQTLPAGNPVSDDSPTHAAATNYAAAGFYVFPLRGKRPRTAHGFKDATRDEEQINKWWTMWPHADIGIATGASGLVAVDIDPRHGGDQSLYDLQLEYDDFPETWTVRTGGGGAHYYIERGRWDIGCSEGNNNGGVAPGIDIRATGGYVAAPPSVHPSGNRYGLQDDADIAPLPLWLGELLTAKKAKRAEPIGEAIPDGERNATLASLAGSMRRRGASEAAIAAALHETNAERCDPPLDDKEVDRIAASIARYAPAASATIAAPPLDGADVEWFTELDGKLRVRALGAGKSTPKKKTATIEARYADQVIGPLPVTSAVSNITETARDILSYGTSSGRSELAAVKALLRRVIDHAAVTLAATATKQPDTLEILSDALSNLRLAYQYRSRAWSEKRGALVYPGEARDGLVTPKVLSHLVNASDLAAPDPFDAMGRVQRLFPVAWGAAMEALPTEAEASLGSTSQRAAEWRARLRRAWRTAETWARGEESYVRGTRRACPAQLAVEIVRDWGERDRRKWKRVHPSASAWCRPAESGGVELAMHQDLLSEMRVDVDGLRSQKDWSRAMVRYGIVASDPERVGHDRKHVRILEADVAAEIVESSVAELGQDNDLGEEKKRLGKGP